MGQRGSKPSGSDETPKFLIYGKSGWIGGLVGELLKEQGIPFEYGKSRLEDRRGIEADIRRVRMMACLLRSHNDCSCMYRRWVLVDV